MSSNGPLTFPSRTEQHRSPVDWNCSSLEARDCRPQPGYTLTLVSGFADWGPDVVLGRTSTCSVWLQLMRRALCSTHTHTHTPHTENRRVLCPRPASIRCNLDRHLSLPYLPSPELPPSAWQPPEFSRQTPCPVSRWALNFHLVGELHLTPARDRRVTVSGNLIYVACILQWRAGWCLSRGKSSRVQQVQMHTHDDPHWLHIHVLCILATLNGQWQSVHLCPDCLLACHRPLYLPVRLPLQIHGKPVLSKVFSLSETSSMSSYSFACFGYCRQVCHFHFIYFFVPNSSKFSFSLSNPHEQMLECDAITFTSPCFNWVVAVWIKCDFVVVASLAFSTG